MLALMLSAGSLNTWRRIDQRTGKEKNLAEKVGMMAVALKKLLTARESRTKLVDRETQSKIVCQVFVGHFVWTTWQERNKTKVE